MVSSRYRHGWRQVAALVLMMGLLVVAPRGVGAQQATGPQSVAELTRLAEDVYMFRSIGHNSMFIVTDEGVIAMDPVAQVNPRADQLYRAAIASVTDQPVRYLIYSHEHADHIEGGAIFADTAQIVSQRRAAAPIAARNDPRTPVPTILFDDHLTLELGGKTVELYYTGRNHTDNSLVLLYPARRILFAVDFIPVQGLPFRTLSGDYPDEWIESLRWVEQNLDFDVLVPGHGRLGTRDTPREVREYFQDLMASIRAAQARGLADNSPEMIDAVRADLGPKYSSWGNWGPYLPENVEGILRSWAGQ